ncbi:hypothetical protein V8G54_020590 [Vigna mungo]|uniref:Uncharacterized protein n=1 Tax=Vigna mungo TaxID=3915 RepID=A0AAQ3NC40_VIGMU
MTSHVQRNGWIRKCTINNLFKHPFVCSLSVMNAIPINPNRWILAWLRHQNLFPTMLNLTTTPHVQIVVVLSTMSTTCSQWFLKTCIQQTQTHFATLFSQTKQVQTRDKGFTMLLRMTNERVLHSVNINISDGSQGKLFSELNHDLFQFTIEELGHFIVRGCTSCFVH